MPRRRCGGRDSERSPPPEKHDDLTDLVEQDERGQLVNRD
jgi:hypothetical protein